MLSKPGKPAYTDRRRGTCEYVALKPEALGRWNSFTLEGSPSRSRKTQTTASLRPYPSLENVPALGQIIVQTAEQAEEATQPTATKVEEDKLS